MQSTVRVISEVTAISEQQFLTDVALGTYLERMSEPVAIDLVIDLKERFFPRNDLYRLDGTYFRVCGGGLSDAEVATYFNLDLFHSRYLTPLLGDLLEGSKSNLGRKIRESFEAIQELGRSARSVTLITGEEVHPQGYKFWESARLTVEFLREIIYGISITREGQKHLARLHHEINQRSL